MIFNHVKRLMRSSFSCTEVLTNSKRLVSGRSTDGGPDASQALGPFISHLFKNKVKKASVSLPIAILWACAMAPANATSFSGCSASEEANIRSAIDFVGANLNLLTQLDLAPASAVRERATRRRYERNYNNESVTCFRNCTDRVGSSYTHWYSVDDPIEICTNVSFHAKFCGLVNTVAHELAHTAGVNQDSDHNNEDGGGRDDRVYKVGQKFGSACVAQGRNSNLAW